MKSKNRLARSGAASSPGRRAREREPGSGGPSGTGKTKGEDEPVFSLTDILCLHTLMPALPAIAFKYERNAQRYHDTDEEKKDRDGML
jgi:hypothetical protein